MSTEDPLRAFLGKRVNCVKVSGKKFSGKLINIYGGELYFETSTGAIVMDKRSLISSMRLHWLEEHDEEENGFEE